MLDLVREVFLTCGASAVAGSRCKFFQWIHTPLYPPPSNPVPEWRKQGRLYKQKPMKSINKESQEWLQHAEQNVHQWKKQQSEKAWLNQFAETTQKQNEKWEAKKKEQVLPSTFNWSPEIAKIYKKTDAWKDIQAMTNNEFEACINRKKHAKWKPPLESESFEKNESLGKLPPSDASLASYLQKRKNQGKTISPAEEKF